MNILFTKLNLIKEGAFQIIGSQVFCEDTNHGPASVNINTKRNLSENLKRTYKR